MAQSTDDLFASLGGSLMKDLFEDLQVGEDDMDADGLGWSLEQLERELAHLDDASPPPQPSLLPPTTQPPPGLSAASLVVSHAQERGINDWSTAATTTPTTAAADAWSQSLEKFTALSLEEDFLAADSARKQKPAANNNMAFLAGAKDYDVSEPMSLGPPPGLASPPTKTTEPSATPKRPPGMPSPPARKPITRVTPQEPVPSLEDEEQDADTDLKEAVKTKIPRPPPPTPQNSFSITRPGPPTPHNSFALSDDAALEEEKQPVLVQMKQTQQQLLIQQQELPKPVEKEPQQPPAVQHPPQQPPAVQHPPQQPPAVQHPAQQPPSQMMQQQPPPHMMQQQQPPMPMQQQQAPPRMMQQQMASPGGAWQTPTRPLPPQEQQRVYCQSHPLVPPIPAGALESTYMKARDITYVLHSMLKPVLLMGVSSSDYHIMLLTRQSQGRQLLQKKQSNNKDEASDAPAAATTPTISLRSKQWMEKHSTLGHVSRTDVTRPRALIATTLVKEEEQAEEKNKHRANLWKSRLYIDQAYQAFTNIVEIWKSAPPGKAPPEIQPHLLRLYKYLGISPNYTVDPQALRLVCKLGKGRTLLARILEQALLPPHAVQALLPVAFQVLLPNSGEGNPSDDRVFRVSSQILSSLPSLESSTVTASVQAFLDHPKYALATTPRMECVHALLRRGNAIATSNQDFAPEWSKTEQEFLHMLGSM